MIDIITGTAFDAPKRMHHAEDEPALEFPSSATSRARGLLALRAQNWRAGGGGGHTVVDGIYSDGVAYTVIPHVQSTNAVRIETAWTWLDGYNMAAKNLWQGAISDRQWIGGVYCNTNSYFQFFCGSYGSMAQTSASAGSSYSFVVEGNEGVSVKVYRNGSEVASRSAPGILSRAAMGIFTQNGGTGNNPVANRVPSKVVCHYFKWWDGGDLVADLVPVVNDGVAQFYDQVTQSYIGNLATSGAFSPYMA